MAVSTVAVILRLIARKISAARYGADDILIIIALVLTYALNVNEMIAVHFGFGKHQLMLSLHQIGMFLLNDWTIQIIFASAISITRLSLLVFYHRTLVPAGIWIVVECNIGIGMYTSSSVQFDAFAHPVSASVCLPLMRPLVTIKFTHIKLSSISTYLSLSKSRRTGPSTTDEEANSSGLRSIGKFCEKPYGGPCLEVQPVRDARQNGHQDSQHASRPISHRGYKGVRTHRSRIESYSPEKYDPLRAHPTHRVKPVRKSAPPILDSRRARRNTYRLSKDEMSERYKKWYQGRGSEVGRGFWSLEILAPTGRKGLRGSDLPWEVGDNRNSHRPPPKSRL
ncbi:MAG: hypothetical protein Q9170_004891 [Blastenia crenularia]